MLLPDKIYIKTFAFLNAFYLLFSLSIIGSACTPLSFWTSVFLTVGINLTVNFLFVHINFFQPVIYTQEKVPTVSPTKQKTGLRELNNPDSNPFVKNNKHEKVAVDGKEVRLYPIENHKFNLDTVAHTMVVGSTGSAKSTLTFTLLKMLQNQYRAKFVICDAGNYDFSQAIAYRRDDIRNVVDLVHTIMIGRQMSGSRTEQRIILVIEEAESYFRELGLLPKKEKDKALGQLASLGTLARKSQLNLFLVGQMSKAVTIPSEIRGNFAGRWLARMPKNISANSFGCPYNLEDLQTGVVYNNNTNSFFRFPKAKEPKLDTIGLSDLTKLANYYKQKYNLEKDEI